MSGLTIFSQEESLEERLAEVLKRQHVVRRVWGEHWSGPEEAVNAICAANPLVVAIGPDVTPDDASDLVNAIDLHRPEIGIVVLANTPSRDMTLELLRSGARDVLDPATISDAELRDGIDSVFNHVSRRITNIAAPPDSHRHRIIALVSPKGGSGKTTLSTNLAVGLARAMPNRVLLLDLDVQFGDVSTALGLTPEHTLTDALGPGSADRTALKVFLTRHDSGLAVLAPPESLAEADELDPDALKRTLAALSEEFPFVVIDTAAGIDEFAMVALELATDLVFVSTTDVPSIRAINKQLEALDRLRIVEASRTFILNRSDAKVGLSRTDIEETLGMRADHTIPSSRVFPVSTNRGVAHIDTGSGDAATKALKGLVNSYLPESAQTGSAKRFFGKGR